MKNVIIIGAGIGGLTAGCLLAKRGHKVTIFESHSMPGGYTAGFYRKGCYFESGTLCFEYANTIYKSMKDIGVLEKIDFQKTGMRIVSPDFDGTPGNFEEFKKIMYGAFPGEKGELDEAFADADKILSVFKQSSSMILPAVMSGTEMLRYMLPMIPMLPKTLRVVKEFGDLTSSEFASRYFEKGSALFNLFSKFSYPETSAVMLVSALAGVFDDIWTVKSGMQSWADILAAKFRELGGELKLKAYVDKIVTRNGAAIGIMCKDAFYKADSVISAGDYKKTFLRLLDDKSLIPERQLGSIESASVSEGFFTVYMALSMPCEELKKHMKYPHVFNIDIKPDCDIYNPDDEDYFSKAGFYLYSSSMVNPALAPFGKSSLMIQCRSVDGWMNRWGGGDKEAYRHLKEKAMDTLIKRAAELIPGLKESIEYKEASRAANWPRRAWPPGWPRPRGPR
jgi:phytoene dehydrogenase-like protein